MADFFRGCFPPLNRERFNARNRALTINANGLLLQSRAAQWPVSEALMSPTSRVARPNVGGANAMWAAFAVTELSKS